METTISNTSDTAEDRRPYVFERFEVDPVNRTLTRGGETIVVTAKVFDILLVFVENPGRLLTKDELIERVWHEIAVEEGNLARNVSSLRKALGDEGKHHKYIATVQGRGYRFIAQVSRASHTGERGGETPQVGVRTRKAYLAVGGLLLLGTIAVGLLSFRPWSGRSTLVNASHISTIEQIRLTTGGKASRAVITPDGRRVVYTENLEVKIKDLETGATRQLVPPLPDVAYIHLAVPPDGKSIYMASRVGRSPVVLYRVPVDGGEPERLLDNLYGGITFSPTSDRFAFLRRYPELNEYALLIANADGTNLRKLAASYRPDHFDGPPSWSPDGQTIVCPAISNEGGFHFSIRAVNVSDGSSREIPTKRWAWLNSLVWLPDSRSMILVGQAEGALTAQLWQLDLAGGFRQMSADSFIYETLSGSADGTKFVAIKKRLESHIWIVENGVPVQITSGFDRYDGLSGLAWAPDGRLIYHSRASGRDALWRMNRDGSDPELLAEDGGGGFCISRDNRFIVFQRNEDGKGLGLSRLDLASGAITRLTTGTDMTPTFDASGEWVIYANFGEKHALFKVPAEGGEPTPIFDEYRTVSSPSVSPDGTRIAFAFGRAQAGSIQSGLGILDAATQRLTNSYNARLTFGTIYERPTVQWSGDGSMLYFVNLDGGVSNVWAVNIADGTQSMFTNFTTGRVFNFAFSPEGGRLALARGTVESDVLVLRPTD